MKQETWKPIVGYTKYEVSDRGRVRSNVGRKPRMLKLQPHPAGHLVCRPHRDGKGSTKRVHLLVAAAFLGPRRAGNVVRFRDGDKTNCSSRNLYYDKATSVPRRRNCLTQADHDRAIRLWNDGDGLPQTQIALLVGCSNSHISKLVRGFVGPPRGKGR